MEQRVSSRWDTAVRCRDLVEYLPLGILVADAGLLPTLANPALLQMLGFATEAEFLRHTAVHGLFAEPVARDRFLSVHGNTDRIQGADVEWLGRGGRLVTLRVSGWRVQDAAGTLRFVLAAEDLTERRLLEEQLRQAQKMETVGRLTSGVAHDLNNLLTVLLGAAEQLPEASDGESAVTELRAAARRAQLMVRRLVGFSRRETLRAHPVDLAAHVSEVGRLLRRLVRAPIDIEVEAQPGVPAVLADESAMDQVLFNLVTNAQDAMPAGGTLRITVRRGADDSEVELVVSDTGMGMDAVTRSRLFEPFFTTKPRGAGSGLGLATVHSIVTRLGGSISVESAPGAGTSVSILLPATQSPDAAPPSSLPAAAQTSAATILLVDDEYALRTVGQRLLQRAGYTVVTAEDGEQALSILRERSGRIDLVLSDVIMPRKGGIELHGLHRADGGHVPFLFMSGYSSDEINDLSRLPADAALVPKPWSPQELLAAVAQSLGARRHPNPSPRDH